jgi:hypothetical protein
MTAWSFMVALGLLLQPVDLAVPGDGCFTDSLTILVLVALFVTSRSQLWRKPGQ